MSRELVQKQDGQIRQTADTGQGEAANQSIAGVRNFQMTQDLQSPGDNNLLSSSSAHGGASEGKEGESSSAENAPEEPQWKKDLVDEGEIEKDDIYEDEEILEYGHDKLASPETKYKNGPKGKEKDYDKVVGKEFKTIGAKKANAVKTLQALLNRSLKDSGLGTAKADDKTVIEPGTLSVDGKWNLDTAAHLMYFIDMYDDGKHFSNLVQKFTVKCDKTIWKALRDKASLKSDRVKQAGVETGDLVDIDGGHKIHTDASVAYEKMKAAYGKTISIASSVRSFSSYGMADLGMSDFTGQLELFALRVSGGSSKQKANESDAAVPTHNVEGKESGHMVAKALDLGEEVAKWVDGTENSGKKKQPNPHNGGGSSNTHNGGGNSGKSGVKNGAKYGFERFDSESWHFDFKPELWNSSEENPANQEDADADAENQSGIDGGSENSMGIEEGPQSQRFQNQRPQSQGPQNQRPQSQGPQNQMYPPRSY